MNRTFIVEECAEDEFGRWAVDEVTGEHGHIDDERSCFRTWDDTEGVWQSRLHKGRQVKRRKGQGKGKHGFKRTETAFRGGEQAQDLEWWSDEDFAWWCKGKKGKKGFSDEGFPKGGFSHLPARKRRRQGFHPE